MAQTKGFDFMKDIYHKLSMLANAMETKVRNNGGIIEGGIPIGAIRTSTLESYLEEIYEILHDMEVEGIKYHIENDK